MSPGKYLVGFFLKATRPAPSGLLFAVQTNPRHIVHYGPPLSPKSLIPLAKAVRHGETTFAVIPG